MVIEVDWATNGDWPVFQSWRSLNSTASDFVFIWHRNGMWGATPPVVAKVDGKTVGFHAVTFLKNGYINSQFQFVLEEYRGMGLAGAMVDMFLRDGYERRMKRLRFRTPKGNDGNRFWCGFGITPIGETEDRYVFDLSVEGVTCLDDLIRNVKVLCASKPTDKRTLGYYKRSGTTLYD